MNQKDYKKFVYGMADSWHKLIFVRAHWRVLSPLPNLIV